LPRLPAFRKGIRLQIKGRIAEFSYWPTYQGSTRIGLQSKVFALDPWTIINSSVKQNVNLTPDSKIEALAYIEQAKDFYNAVASSAIAAARPLVLYYCFLNLAKAFVIHRGTRATITQIGHGLKERMGSGNQELVDAFLIAEKSPNQNHHLQIFDEFLRTINLVGLTSNTNLELKYLLPQVLSGHRLWCEATGEIERFVAIHDIRVKHGNKSKTIWLELYFLEDDLKRLRITHKDLLSRSRTNNILRQVTCSETYQKRKLIRFEQIVPLQYSHRPSDVFQNLVATIRESLWTVIANAPPYRHYYFYMAPLQEHPQILPQLLSIYAVTFYLGSITRYRPHHFDRIIDGIYGPRVEEFISGQPLQFIYLMASEFAKQEITRPAIV